MTDSELVARLDLIRLAAFRCGGRAVPELIDRLILDVTRPGSVRLADVGTSERVVVFRGDRPRLRLLGGTEAD